MGEQEENPNPINLPPDLQEEIFLRLPLKPILRFKTLSKQWRSILESRKFAEKRMKVRKKQKILAAGHHRLQGDAEEIEVVYLECDVAAKTPSLTCDGLVCLPVPGWVNVLNPSTGEFVSFPSGPDPFRTKHLNFILYSFTAALWNIFPGYWAMGFGKDQVDGSYKVVRMFFEPTYSCEILDVSVGEWRKVNPPPYVVDVKRKSVCVNGSIYWLEVVDSDTILALDLHTQEFRDVPVPPISTVADQFANLEDRLAIAVSYGDPDWILEIWTIDAQEKTWSMMYSIDIDLCAVRSPDPMKVWFRPLAISRQGNLFFCDNEKRLFKYYPTTNELSCLSSNICVLSDFVENLVSLRPSSGPETSRYRSGFHYQDLVQDHVQGSQQIEKFGWIKKRIPNILITTTLVYAVVFRYFSVSRMSRIY